ncbi:MAG: trehalose-phosphatase [Myxococcota bacterium]
MVSPVRYATLENAVGAAWKIAVADALAHAERPLLVLDYDGTLAPIAATPEKAKPTSEIIALLESAIAVGITVAVVSGRDGPTLQKWLGHLPIHLVSEHGGAHRKPGGVFVDRVKPETLTWFPTARAILAEVRAKTAGSILEPKRFSFSFHYRNVEARIGEQVVDSLAQRLREHLPETVELHRGKMVLEVRPAGIHKGVALADLAALTRADFAIAAGDDRTDEDMFVKPPDGTWTIKIGAGPTQARVRLDSVTELRGFLLEAISARRVVREEKQHG